MAAIMIGSVPAFAEELPSEEDYLGEVPVVLSVTRLKQPRAEAPASITIIDRKMIEASGAQHIPDLLRLVPGFQVGHLSDGRVTVTYHGLSDSFARRLQVLVDGRSVYSPMFGGINWPDLPLALEDIERIEVIRGPNSVTYGSNSFLAVVNIITRHSTQDQGHTGLVTGGDIGTKKAVYRFGGLSKRFSYRFTAKQREDDGFREENDSTEISLLTFRGDYTLSNRDSLEFQFGINYGLRGTGKESSTTNPIRNLKTSANFQQFRWKRNINKNEAISLQFYHNYYKLSDTYGFVKSGFSGTAVEDYRNDRYDIEFQHTLSPLNHIRLVWGAEARRDIVTAPGWFGTTDSKQNKLYRLFVNSEWRFKPRWVLNSGVMYEHNDLTGSDISPRLALNYQLTKRHTFRVAASRAFRIPSLFEDQANAALRFGPFIDQLSVGFGDVTPERITSREIGYIGNFPSKKVVVDFKIYWDKIENVISGPAAFDPFGADNVNLVTLKFSNGGTAKIRGAELELQFHPTKKTRVYLAVAYANQRGTFLRDTTGLLPPTYGQTDSSTPVHTQSLMIMHDFPRNYHASVTVYKMSNISFIGNVHHTGGYNSLDFRIAKKIEIGNSKGEIALIGQHLTGDYFDIRKEQVFDKRFFLTLKLGI